MIQFRVNTYRVDLFIPLEKLKYTNNMATSDIPPQLFRTPDQNRKTLSGGRMPVEINSLILIHTIKYTPTLLKLKYVCAEKFYSKTDTFQTQFR